MAEFELSQEELFERVPIGLFRSKLEGSLLEANATLVRMLGYPDKATLLNARPDQIFFQPEEVEVLVRELDGVGEIRSFDMQLLDYRQEVAYFLC